MLLSAVDPENLPEGLGFSEFLGLLGAELRKDPAALSLAESFKREFMDDPALSKLFAEFKALEEQGKKPSASHFLAAARSLDEFRKLAARYGAKPGASDVFARVSRNPALSRVMADAARNARRAQAPRGALDGFGPVGAHAGARSFPRAVAAAGSSTGTVSALSGPPPGGAGTIGEAHEVGAKLAKLRGAGNVFDIRYFASLFVNLPVESRRRMELACDRRISRNEGCDVIDICLEAETYAGCEQACRADSECAALGLFPPTPVFTAGPSVVAVGSARTLTVSRTAPNAQFIFKCAIDGVEKCGNVFSADAWGGLTHTSNVPPEQLNGSGYWCGWVVSNGKTSNQACIQIVAAP
ncbi:MAG: hypothetical protein HY553_19360 [Elusimicrobia bacterium]|nr:hypothetical protein [Elusimicrobiota bacterium]